MFKQQLLQNFEMIAHQTVDPVSIRLILYFQEAYKIKTQLNKTKDTGKKCHQQALWIGVERFVSIS